MSKTNNEAPEVNADAPVTDAPETGSDSSEANGPESISLQDLGLLAQIVDLATQRGAFRGNELSQVGGIYDKLTSFLTACLLYTSPRPRDAHESRMPSSA